MKRRQRQAIILVLADSLKRHGSWCGETHLQKAIYFLEELANVPLGFEFILYKHGPFSFELRDEITAMRADGLMEVLLQPYPYGPSLIPTDSGIKLRQRWPKTLNKYADDIEYISRYIGTKGVAELERLATALYLTKKYPDKDVKSLAHLLNSLKPHISVEDAKKALNEIGKKIEEQKG